jgi:spermidine/putrescine-binding protein
LPFDPAKLDGLSEKLIRSHWENNYQGAVNALNAIEPKIPGLVADKDWPPYLLDDVKREALLRTGSVIMHQLYFGNLGGDGKVSGDIVACWMGWAAMNTFASDKGTKTVKTILPTEGSYGFSDAWAIPPGADNVSTIYSWMNETLDPTRNARPAGCGPDHLFMRKYRLFESGRWPLGVLRGAFHLL